MTVTDVAAFDLGTGDFTIEGWYYLANAGTYVSLFDFRGSGADGVYPSLLRNNTGDYIYYYVDSAQRISNVAINYNTWFHVAVCRSSGITRLFLNGKEKGSFQDSFDYVSRDILLGVSSSNNNDLTGNISNYRIVKGRALYTANFKPPMKELEVTPETVLLACQSKTDATLEKTGKTITASGAVASELTPGILTPIVKSGGGSAITGSVEFDGTGDYLTIPNTEDLRLADSDFTIELWATISKVDSTYSPFALFENSTALRSYQLEVRSNGAVRFEWWYNGSSANDITTGTGAVIVNEWYHYAVSRNGATLKLFINGIEVGSSDVGTNSFFNNTVTPFIIGGMFQSGVQQQKWQGNISNFRINKGTALYTADFIPPTRELKKVPGTVLLCCQDENSVTTEVTGKTITSNGDPAASNFTPQVGDDRQITFEGVTKINSENYFYLPTGDTITRESRYGRGIFMGGYTTSPSSAAVGDIHYINIPSMGNSRDFGDLVNAARWAGGSCGSSTRGLYGGGATPASTDHIDFVTIATTSNALDFGNLATTQGYVKACSNATRGIWGGGRSSTSPTVSSNVIQYITIASTGAAIDFGNLTSARTATGNTASPVRALFGGGYTSPSTTAVDVIDYVTIASTGDATDFGDLLVDVRYSDVASSGIRGLWGGGSAPTTDTIQYVTISSTGNALDFGDLTASIAHISCTDNSIRGVWGGGVTPTYLNVLQYVTIATTGDAKDFGDLSRANLGYAGGTSDSHGGLG